ncbi:MAG: hypothetical protein U0836_17955 [Pirellulales bacterium]
MQLALDFLTNLIEEADTRRRRLQDLIDFGGPSPEKRAVFEDERMQLAAKIEPARAALADLKAYRATLYAEETIHDGRERMNRAVEQAKAEHHQKNT